jgi:AcrR family transcriptional regulator
MWPFTKKPTITRQISTITELNVDERGEIETSTAAGMSPRDIADALGLPVSVVYAYRKTIKAQAVAQQADPYKSALAELQAAKVKAEIAAIEQKAAQDKAEHDAYMAAEFNDAEEDDGEDWASVIGKLAPLFAPRAAAPAAPPISAPSGAAPVPAGAVLIHMTDEEITDILSTVPSSVLKVAKKMPDDQLAGNIKRYYPRADDDSVSRAMRCIREN